MTFSIVRAADTRETVTPSATMTTLASPTLGDTERHSLWHVALEAGAAGPVHTISSEQVWHLISGTVTCDIAGETITLHPGDTLRVAEGALRQFVAIEAAQFVVCGESTAQASVPGGSDPVTPPWIA